MYVLTTSHVALLVIKIDDDKSIKDFHFTEDPRSRPKPQYYNNIATLIPNCNLCSDNIIAKYSALWGEPGFIEFATSSYFMKCHWCSDCTKPRDRTNNQFSDCHETLYDYYYFWKGLWWLVHAVIILVLCVYTQLWGSAELCSSFLQQV